MALLILLAFLLGAFLGLAVGATYYTDRVREAFGLGKEISVLGYLHTKAIKRGIESGQTPLRKE